ncbi:MAG: hypothetical protein ACLPV8_28855 [Steroidobacteraceae bacterium]
MALFQYFPNNYVWNLSINIAIESGARIGEIEEMCRPLLEAAARGQDAAKLRPIGQLATPRTDDFH